MSVVRFCAGPFYVCRIIVETDPTTIASRPAGEPSEGGHDGDDCGQRANYFERLSDDEGEDAAENRAILVGTEGSYIFSLPHK